MWLKECLSELRPTWGSLGLWGEQGGCSQLGAVERKRYNWGIGVNMCGCQLRASARIIQLLHQRLQSVHQGVRWGGENLYVQAGLCSWGSSAAGGPVPPGFQCALRTPLLRTPILNYRKEGGSREPKTSPYLKATHIEVPRPHPVLGQEEPVSALCHGNCHMANRGCAWPCCSPQQPPSPRGLLFKMWVSIRSAWDAFENSLLGPSRGKAGGLMVSHVMGMLFLVCSPFLSCLFSAFPL